MLIIATLATLIGVSLGLLGGGGSILAVPLLAYVAQVPAKEAIATSLIVVGGTAAISLIQHARRGDVAWRTGAVFAAAAMLGAFGGGRAAHLFSGSTLLLLFAAMMIVTAAAMFRGRREQTASAERTAPFALIMVEGVVVGAATGLVGAGGGFLVVPALVLLGGMPIHQAVGTSLLVISLKSFAGFWGYAGHVTIDLELTATVTVAAMVGSLVGAYYAQKVPAQRLRQGFAVFVLLMAALVIWQEREALMGTPNGATETSAPVRLDPGQAELITVPVQVHGALREMMHMGRLERRVDLAPLIGQTGLYGVGALENLAGEVTIWDGAVWVSKPDGRGGHRSAHVKATSDGAALLVTAQVATWQRRPVKRAVPFEELDGFIEAQAQAAGVAIEEPFPFLLVGSVARADWHVIDGSKIEPGVHGHEAHIRSAVRGTLSDQPVRLVGFFSIKHHTIFTHHDTDTHAHLIHTEPPLTGHVDHLVLSPGAELYLPARP